MIKTMPMIWARNQHSDNPCVACGRPLKSHAHAIHVIEGGSKVLHPDSETEYVSDNGDMYFHFLGPECRKKFKDFVVEWTESQREEIDDE